LVSGDSSGGEESDSCDDFFCAENECLLSEDLTINLDWSMTLVEMQALIDAQPKNLNKNTLTFQFADGTYTFGTSLRFDNFHNGNLRVYGNPTENANSTHENQAVIFDASALTSYSNILYFWYCNADILVANISFKLPTVTIDCIVGYCSNILWIKGCRFWSGGSPQSNNWPVPFTGISSTMDARYCTIGTLSYAGQALYGTTLSCQYIVNDSTGHPVHRFIAYNGGHVSVGNSTVSGSDLTNVGQAPGQVWS
jgi:hypothetical protein